MRWLSQFWTVLTCRHQWVHIRSIRDYDLHTHLSFSSALERCDRCGAERISPLYHPVKTK
jgi:hypothetical protein